MNSFDEVFAKQVDLSNQGYGLLSLLVDEKPE